MEKYFAAAASDDVSPIFAFYEGRFYSATPKKQWEEMYTSIRSKLGKPTQHSLATWQARSNVGAGGNGFLVTLVYNVQYEKASGVETFWIFVPTSTQIARITGHHFESAALLK